jgi:decaprenyl-phosphate phosphoribosyltransferase
VRNPSSIAVPRADKTRSSTVIARTSSALAFVRAMRPKQWSKNVLVFAAPGAAGLLGRPEVLTQACVAFVAFCLVASGTYLVNDVVDAPLDRGHPVKRERPVAAGHLSARAALAGAAVLFALGAALGSWLGPRFLLVLAAYLAVTAAYSLALQRIAVIDLIAVASGFVLRAVAGSAATGVRPSAWFLILACSAAVFVVAGRRMADARAHEATGRPAGHVVYPIEYLRGVWMLSAGVTITAYCLWAFAVPHTIDGVAWSQVSIVPFAAAILRYAYEIELGQAGAPEAVFLRDRTMQVLAVSWVVVYALGVYLR